MSRLVIDQIGHLTLDTDPAQEEILLKEARDIVINLSDSIALTAHEIFARTPLTKAGDLSVP